MRRLRRLQALQQLDLPVILLVGGATGTGKSTLATEVAHRLGITRVTSTDFIRQTMRAFFSREFMPSVHYSSFEAELALTRPTRTCGRRGAARVPRPDAQRARRGRGRDRPRADGGLVDGARGRPPRARDDRASTAPTRSSSSASSRSPTRTSTAATSGCVTRRPTACGRSRSTSKGCRDPDDPGVLLERARRFDVPVIENVSLDDAIGAGARPRADGRRAARAGLSRILRRRLSAGSGRAARG